MQEVSVAESQHQLTIADTLQNSFAEQLGSADSQLHWAYTGGAVKQLWTTNTQVNYCARAYSTVPSNHEDAPALVILGDILRNGYLHRAIREQGGAYGGGASQDNNSGCFRFYSYRDPRSVDTFADYDGAIAWAAEGNINRQHLEEAVLGVIGSLDKPGSPAGEALATFQNNLHNRTPKVRKAFRQRLLKVTLEDISKVVRVYLQNKPASEVVVGPNELTKIDYFKGFQIFQV